MVNSSIGHCINIFSEAKIKVKKPKNYQCYKERSKILASSADKSINPWQGEAQSGQIKQLPVTYIYLPKPPVVKRHNTDMV